MRTLWVIQFGEHDGYSIGLRLLVQFREHFKRLKKIDMEDNNAQRQHKSCSD